MKCLTFVYLPFPEQDPCGCAELSPASFLGEEVSPGRNQTHDPASVYV